MDIKFMAKFSELIIDTQLLAKDNVLFINKREPEYETLIKLKVNTHVLLKQFSDSYNKIKESFTVPENTDKAVMQFLKNVNEQKKKLNSIVEYADFFSFIISELNNIKKTEAKESMPHLF